MESNSPVTCKTVKRYYWNGKGYATKRQAYTAKAKRILLEMVLGPVVDRYYGDDERESSYPVFAWADANLKNCATEQEKKRRIDARFAEFFPHLQDSHSPSPLALREGCVDAYTGFGYSGCHQYGEERGYEFRYESCKWSQQEWIKAKVKELMEADGAN